MSIKTVGFMFGVAFGLVLGCARLTDYDVIHDTLWFHEPDVFLLMMSAMAIAAIGARFARYED